jgi:hypothetical protein
MSSNKTRRTYADAVSYAETFSHVMELTLTPGGRGVKGLLPTKQARSRIPHSPSVVGAPPHLGVYPELSVVRRIESWSSSVRPPHERASTTVVFVIRDRALREDTSEPASEYSSLWTLGISGPLAANWLRSMHGSMCFALRR